MDIIAQVKKRIANSKRRSAEAVSLHRFPRRIFKNLKKYDKKKERRKTFV
jgi:hypothetical protein